MANEKIKIGFLCGSLRKESINKKLSIALQKECKTMGFMTDVIGLEKFNLPIYHGDLDTPKSVNDLIARMKEFDAIIIVTPEYNGGLPPVLKNAIDWTSCVELGHISDKVFGIASCSPGPMSGIMAMRQLQFLLMRLGANVVPTQTGCGMAETAFCSDGELVAEPAKTLASNMILQIRERVIKQGQ